jgi:NhaP-type Na+/H+ and K+/H+ antiporter
VAVLLLIYGVALLIATLLSEWSNRTVLSSAVLFLAVGFLAGPRAIGLVSVERDSPFVTQVSKLALFAILLAMGCGSGGRISAVRGACPDVRC